MYIGIEFREVDGGGLAIVHDRWLTPRKTNVWWPPFKQSDKFEKCLRKGDSPNENWSLYAVKKQYFQEQDCEKAKKKLKKAEVTSEITSGDESDDPLPKKRRTIPNKRLFSTDEDSENEPAGLPTPPNVKGISKFLNPTCSQITKKSPAKEKLTTVAHVQPEQTSGPLNTDLQKILHQVLLVKNQNEEILNILRTKHNLKNLVQPDLPVSLPIKNIHDLNILEGYIQQEGNCALMVNYYSNLGGRDVVQKTNNILRAVISNSVAANFSFMGTRNDKRQFSSLELKKFVVETVLKGCNTATVDEIHSSIKIWLKHAPKRLAHQEQKLNRLNRTV